MSLIFIIRSIHSTIKVKILRGSYDGSSSDVVVSQHSHSPKCRYYIQEYCNN